MKSLPNNHIKIKGIPISEQGDDYNDIEVEDDD